MRLHVCSEYGGRKRPDPGSLSLINLFMQLTAIMVYRALGTVLSFRKLDLLEKEFWLIPPRAHPDSLLPARY